MKNINLKYVQSGQTLVALLFFVMIGIIATSAATIMLFTNLLSGQKFENSEIVRQSADAGGEKALLQLLRDPNYLGETFVIEDDEVTIVVAGTTNKTIDVTSVNGNTEKKIVITASLINNILTVVSGEFKGSPSSKTWFSKKVYLAIVVSKFVDFEKS